MLPGVTRIKCVSTDRPRESSDRPACTTHCEQRLQLREQKTLTETSQEVTSLSLARAALILCVVVKWSGYVQQRTGVQLLIVEQEYLLLGTDVKHSEVQNLFSLLKRTCDASHQNRKTVNKKISGRIKFAPHQIINITAFHAFEKPFSVFIFAEMENSSCHSCGVHQVEEEKEY